MKLVNKKMNQYFILKHASVQRVIKRTSNRHYYDRYAAETVWTYAPGCYDRSELDPITHQQAVKLLRSKKV